MLLYDFKLEIMVDNKPLHEYDLLDSSLNLGNSSGLKSYVFMEKEKRKMFSEYTTFVAVPKPGTRYDIVITACNATESDLIAKIYVDGKTDGLYYKLCSNLNGTISGFYNKGSTMKYKFIFDHTEWAEGKVDLQKINYGGLGAISVYVYKAKVEISEKRGKRERNKKQKKGKFRDVSNVIEQTKVPEMKKCIDIVYTTKFGEGEKVIPSRAPCEMTLIAADMEPLAVLHINYRPIEWLIMKEIPELKSAGSPSDSIESKPIKSELDNKLIKVELNDDVIKQECEKPISQDPIIINDDDLDEVFINRKRKIAEAIEVIEILDSDVEC